jgi:hypothetical protein
MTTASQKHFVSVVAAIFCAFIMIGSSVAPAINPVAQMTV